MDKYSKYYEKKKDYKNAYKRLRYKLETKKITKSEYNSKLYALKKEYKISN